MQGRKAKGSCEKIGLLLSNLSVKETLMKKIVWMSTLLILIWIVQAGAATVFYDSFTRSGELVGTTPDWGGGAYVYVPTLPGNDQVKEGTGNSAHLEITADAASGSFNNFSIRTALTGLNYAYSPFFYMTATFNSSAMPAGYTGHLGVEVGVNVWNSVGNSLVRQQQIGLGRSGWYGDLGADTHTVAWGSGTSFGRHSLGGYNLGDTVTLALKFVETPMNLSGPTQYFWEAFAGEVPLSGAEPTWIKIAGEANKHYTYEVDYIGLIIGNTDGGPSRPVTTSGYIDEIRIGKTWADVQAVPIPGAVWLLGSGLIGLAGLPRRKQK
jgi:hypothetical protein